MGGCRIAAGVRNEVKNVHAALFTNSVQTSASRALPSTTCRRRCSGRTMLPLAGEYITVVFWLRR